MDEPSSPAGAADRDDGDELLVGPLTQLCLELDAFCERADPLLARLDHVCEQLPRFLRRVATPW
jgi:hypothetical protein